ncbi:MAG: Gfo/Idh/MocA family oxidoreductase [Calditrichia bacterium]
MSSRRIKIGVVGVGHLGRWHVQQLKAIPEADLVGIYDIDVNRSKDICREFGVKAFPDFSQLLDAVEAISIVTPTTTHFQYARESLERGRHVFIEKPITETVEQGNELIEIVDRSGVKFQVGHIERFNPAILALEDISLNPLFIESHRLSTFHPRGTDVAVVLDLMIHDIDLILSFVHSPVKSIQASGVSIISPKEDIANCRLEFENGCVANVTASRISTRKMRKMRFFQPNAYISVDFLEGSSEIYQLMDEQSGKTKEGLTFSLGQIGEENQKKEIRYRRVEKKDINPLRYELELFLQSIKEDRPTAVTVREAVRDLAVAQAILKSIEEHTAQVRKHWRI